MLIKETKPFNALVFRIETTLPQLRQYVGHVAKDLYREAARLELTVTGPICWTYYGIDGKPDTVFTLEIALPVQEKEVVAQGFEWQRMDSFRCVETRLEGSWEQLPQTYAELMNHLKANGLTMINQCRETYVNMDFDNCDNNITEVQLRVM